MITLSPIAAEAYYIALRKHDKFRANQKKWTRFVLPLVNRFAKLHDCPRGQAEQHIREYEGALRVKESERFILNR